MTEKLVSDYCMVKKLKGCIIIGDDMRMNGIDSPARLNSKSQLITLIQWLQDQIEVFDND